MIKAHTETNLGAASKYFKEHLSSGDYYSSTGQTPGVWQGKAAEMLGLSGMVSEKDFLHLCAGEKPDGSKLTQRLNTVRQGKEPNRRIFYDWCFSPPKSVSLAALVHGDSRIQEAHAKAVAAAGKELENYAFTRVREKADPMNGRDRRTGNLCMAAFTHETSRSVTEGQVPDANLHTHLLLFNVTKDGDEWKALQNCEMLKAQKYVSAVYDHELCRQLKRMGYQLREKGESWELAHISDETCAKFSKRHNAIEETTAKLEAKGVTTEHEKLKDKVAHEKRIRKSGNMTAEVMRESWLAQMTEQERVPHNHIVSPNKMVDNGNEKGVSEALGWTERHLFERSAVVKTTDFLASALKYARGGDFSIEDLRAEFDGNTSILREVGGNRITTQEALECEKFILRLVKDGQGKFQPFAPGLLATPAAERLSPMQRQAAEYVLSSGDMVSVFRGSAGVGKSTSLVPVNDALVASGYAPVVLAPQNKQVDGLRQDGFTEAQTVSAFLAGENTLQANSVLIVDESGLIGGENMADLLARAKSVGCRVILVGDTGQHQNISRSSALAAIQKYATPHIAKLMGEKAIIRQRNLKYRKAVARAETGNTDESFQLLDELGSIRDVDKQTRVSEAARLYVEKLSKGSVLAVSQTNKEVDSLNLAIRDELGKANLLDMSNTFNMQTLRQVDTTVAERERATYYPKDSVVMLNRKVGKHKAGTSGILLREGENCSVVLSIDGNELIVKQQDLKKLTVYEKRELSLCAGDKIVLKANIKIKDTRLANGQLLTVVGQDKKGGLVVMNDYDQKFALPADFQQFQYGYAVSSQISQGSTVDHVIISDSGSVLATSQKGYYVSLSRARETCTILTADRGKFQENIAQRGDQDLAVDLELERGGKEFHSPARPDVPEVALKEERDIASIEEIKPHLGNSDAKNRPVCIDEKTGDRVELFGNKRGNFMVRGFAELSDILVRGIGKIRGLLRVREHERGHER